MSGVPTFMDRYLNEQPLADAEMAELSAWLVANEEHVAEFVLQSHIDSQLKDLHQKKAYLNLVADTDEAPSDEQIMAELVGWAVESRDKSILHGPRPDPGEAKGATKRLADESKNAPRVIVIPRAVVWLSAAAAVLLAVLLFWPSKPNPGINPAPVVENEPETKVDVLSLPPVLSEVYNARWINRDRPLEVGQPVAPGQYHLLSGLARFEMSSGTSVLVEGPALIHLDRSDLVGLEHGRLTADVPEAGHGFTVVTPDSRVVDLGTSFGVEAVAGSRTHTQVFDGLVTLASTVADAPRPIGLRGGEAATVDSGSANIRLQPVDPERFVRQQTFDSLLGKQGEEARGQALARMWARDPSMLAGVPYLGRPIREAYGFRPGFRLAPDANVTFEAQQDLPGAPELPFGGRMVFDARQNASMFLDMDLSSFGPAAKAQVLSPDGRGIGRDHTRVCIAWEVALLEGTPTEAEWFGLSLFQGVDDMRLGELVFVGQPTAITGWAAERYPVLPAGDRERNRPIVELNDAGPVPIELGRTYRWLMVIDFQPGNDRVSIYLDPDAEALGTPDLVIDDIDAVFDRLRIEAVKGTCRWGLTDLRLGTDPTSLLRGL